MLKSIFSGYYGSDRIDCGENRFCQRCSTPYLFNVYDFKITPHMLLTYISMMNTQWISFSVSLRKTTNCFIAKICNHYSNITCLSVSYPCFIRLFLVFCLSLKLYRWVVCVSAVNSHMFKKKTRRIKRSNANGRLDGSVCLYKKNPTFLIHSPIQRCIKVQH